jgi:hypothetical protein
LFWSLLSGATRLRGGRHGWLLTTLISAKHFVRPLFPNALLALSLPFTELAVKHDSHLLTPSQPNRSLARRILGYNIKIDRKKIGMIHLAS